MLSVCAHASCLLDLCVFRWQCSRGVENIVKKIKVCQVHPLTLFSSSHASPCKDVILVTDSRFKVQVFFRFVGRFRGYFGLCKFGLLQLHHTKQRVESKHDKKDQETMILMNFNNFQLYGSMTISLVVGYSHKPDQTVSRIKRLYPKLATLPVC